MRRNNNTPWKYLGLVILLGIALAIGWNLLSPSQSNAEVNVSVPTAVAPAATESSAPVVEETAIGVSVQAAAPDVNLTLLAQGSFYNIVHIGSGQAGVYQLADGSRMLRLENFQVESGPDLYVYLVPVDPVPSASGNEIPGSVSLGSLQSNLGDQTYEIPAGLDLGQYQSVVIWCQSFAVPFSAAPLVTQ